MSHQSISILGCGWLGLPLAHYLVRQGYSVRGSTTTEDKLTVFKQSNITPYLIRCAPEIQGEELNNFFQSQVLFLNIPFKRNLEDPIFYKTQISSVVSQIENSQTEFVIFASSTSVYPQSSEFVKETDIIQAENQRQKILLEIEGMLMKGKTFKSTIIRFGGLYGYNRKIGKFLSTKKDLSSGDAPVNLIHLDDCIGIVDEIIRKNIQGEIFNACSDAHPTRRELYVRAAQVQGCEPPTFKDEQVRKNKIVSNEKIKEFLSYQFKHPDPMNSVINS